MKKIFGLLFLVLLINSCDDGDATVVNIPFDETDAKGCGQLIFRITENRVMILQVDPAKNLFKSDQTAGTPRLADIVDDAIVTYREYDGLLDGNTLCMSPPPLTPIATSEWPAIEGTVEVTTTAVPFPANSETGQAKIDKFRHLIIFRNLKLAKPDGTTQTYPEYVFGNYYTEPDNDLAFEFAPEDVAVCPATNTIYNAQNSGAEGLYIQNYSPEFLSTANLDVPRTFALGGTGTQNALIYKLLDGSIASNGNETYFCTGSNTPPAKETWLAVSGTIEVTTTSVSPNFQHTIRLKNVTFRKGNTTFYYGDDMLYGYLLTPLP